MRILFARFVSCNLLNEPRYSYWENIQKYCEGRQNSFIFGDCSCLVLDRKSWVWRIFHTYESCVIQSFVKSAPACQPLFLPPFQQYFMWRKRVGHFFLLAQTKLVCWVGIGCTCAHYIREQMRACMFKAEPRSFQRLPISMTCWLVYCRLRSRWRWTRCRCSPRSGPTGSPFSSPSSSHSAASPPSLSA